MPMPTLQRHFSVETHEQAIVFHTMMTTATFRQTQTMELQYESQNTESPFGLYGPLNERLDYYRCKLDQWAENQKELADKAAAEHKAIISKKQAEIDHNATSLIALNIGENLHVDGKENIQDVQERVQTEQQRVETLQKQLEGKKEELEGKQHMAFQICFSLGNLSHDALKICEKSTMNSRSERSKCDDKSKRQRCPKRQPSMISRVGLSTTSILDWILNAFQKTNYGKSPD